MKLIFPGSFDPFTKGHESVARRALEFCDEMVIAVGYNGQKKNSGLFSVEDRVKMISEFYHDEPRIKVIAYSTLTTDVAKKMGCTHILRGVRTVIDFEYERQLADVTVTYEEDAVRAHAVVETAVDVGKLSLVFEVDYRTHAS